MWNEPHARFAILLILSLLSPFLSGSASSLSAQSPSAARNARQLQQKIQQQRREAAANQPKLPADPQLLGLHREFIVKAEKLASEYERKKQYAQAREVYESLVRLVPKYATAEAGLKRVLNSQSLQDKKVTEVFANQPWQDSGAILREGMPVHVDVKGLWTVVYKTGPKGIEIPKEMKPRDARIKLGSLIAVIANSPADLTEARPFVLEGGDDFIAKKSGRLYLRMFDVDPSDNEGSMFVLIQSTFLK
jgi:hypothetical protein